MRLTRLNSSIRTFGWHFARWLSQRSLLLTSLSYKALFRLWEIQGRLPIVIYQMSKVGSTSIAMSLRNSKKLAVFQVHAISTSDIENSLRSKVQKGKRVYSRAIWESKYLNKRFSQHDNSVPWHVITLIREPIARNISAYFQNIELWCPEICDSRITERVKLEIVKEAFFDRFNPHDLTLRWLDDRLEPVIGIDVYNKPFPFNKGYEIYEDSDFRLLLIRLEDLSSCYEPAVKAFLGIRDCPLVSANIGEEKRYANLYKKFLISGFLKTHKLNQLRYPAH